MDKLRKLLISQSLDDNKLGLSIATDEELLTYSSVHIYKGDNKAVTIKLYFLINNYPYFLTSDGRVVKSVGLS